MVEITSKFDIEDFDNYVKNFEAQIELMKERDTKAEQLKNLIANHMPKKIDQDKYEKFFELPEIQIRISMYRAPDPTVVAHRYHYKIKFKKRSTAGQKKYEGIYPGLRVEANDALRLILKTDKELKKIINKIAEQGKTMRKLANQFKNETMPIKYLLEKDGKLIYIHVIPKVNKWEYPRIDAKIFHRKLKNK
ncbi:hypothetical protein LCGC14_0195820 [marine sediment metagenome]|uniref:Uncharacterized protein n=1 Tax=marine sediment metagenome TaxID=412755 RepID=A0A0F9UQ27_9ZZZZ